MTARGPGGGPAGLGGAAGAVEPGTFVDWFRSTAPYIHAHRGRTFVITFGGEALQSPGLYTLVEDVALLHSLGVRLVLVVGARPQIDDRLREIGKRPRYVRGVRITDAAALACVKEAAGTVRVEMEALLSMGLPSSPMAGARLRVAAGNFVTARPVGVIDGVDYEHTGAVRRIDADAIKQRLDDQAVVLLTPIGTSITGEVFNVSCQELAGAVATAIGADKLIALVEGRVGHPAHELTTDAVAELLRRRKKMPADLRLHLRAAADAVRGGVRRAHLVERENDGGLLMELFTRDGIGTLVTNETYEGVRPARNRDVPGILALIEPLEEEGILVRRSVEMLENDIDRFMVIERDGMVIGCAALYPFPAEKVAEIACVAVHPTYRGSGRGDLLLSFLERRCRELGLSRLFVLTTQSAHFFRERGFEHAAVRDLPAERRKAYSRKRRSKVLLKSL